MRGSALQVRSVSHFQNADEQLSKSITVKIGDIEDGNIRDALRLLLSDETLAEVNDATFFKLH